MKSTAFVIFTLLAACGGGSDDDDDEGGGDDNPGVDGGGDTDEPDGGGDALESGVYSLEMTFFTDNPCGVDQDLFFPQALTVTVSGSSISFEELDVDGEISGGEFEVERELTHNYAAEGLDCSLDFRTRMEGTVLSPVSADVVLDSRIDETPLEPDADCEFIATTELGFQSWNPIAGCHTVATFRLEK
jgi:hypothetical protein